VANYGIIDCGSNTVRLCVYQVRSDAQPPFRKRDLKTLLNHKTMAGLASHVVDGSMTARGIERAAEAIRGHMQRADYFDCKQLAVFATAFLRNCDNSADARAAIETKAGIPVDLLSARDEAHLGYVGASCADEGMGEGVLVDIGGGSTEFTRISNSKDSDNISIPCGSLSSFSSRVAGIMPTEEEMNLIACDFRNEAMRRKQYRTMHCKTVYGIGGSMRAMAKLFGEAFCNGKKPDTLMAEDVERLLRLYRQTPDAFAHIALQAVPDRIHTVVPGCIITREITAGFAAQSIRICRGGVREGYLIERMLTKHAEGKR
jgi:exopolyphosphatase/guanosine-5'-triphosphate,3'-diphosphate pyrophosphatase